MKEGREREREGAQKKKEERRERMMGVQTDILTCVYTSIAIHTVMCAYSHSKST